MPPTVRLLAYAGCALSLLLPAGCGGAETDVSEGGRTSGAVTDVERDSALALLSSLERDAFEGAFDALPRYAYTRHTRTEQLDADGEPIAAQERTVRHRTERAGRARTVVAADSAGAFGRGLLGRLADADGRPADPPDVAPHVIPEEPAYLSARNEEDFTFRLLPDTTLADVRASGVEVRARATSDQSLRRLRLYLVEETPVAVYLERADRSLLYREASRFAIELQPAPSGGWVPYRTDVRTRLKRLLRPAQRFATASTYRDFEGEE